MVLRPHMVSDLRLLWRVLRCDAGSSRTPPTDVTKLLESVLPSMSAVAARTLGELCQELADEPPAGAYAPRLELLSSPMALPEEMLGIRAGCHIPPGRLTCIYPGRIFYGDERNLPNSDKLYGNEFEGVSFDGAGWLPQIWKQDPLLADQPASTLWHANRLAVGNLCNHPPEGVLPNLVPMAFRWPTWQELAQTTPAHWAGLVPHEVIQHGEVVRTASGMRKPLQNGEEQIPFPPWPHLGIGLVSIRHVQAGDELFWNYRLHPRADSDPDAQFPPWYVPVDDEAVEAAVEAAAADS